MDRIQHKQLQKELSGQCEYLEKLVAERTAELQKINAQLRQEIAVYKQIEEMSEQKGLRLHEALEMLEKRLIINALE